MNPNKLVVVAFLLSATACHRGNRTVALPPSSPVGTAGPAIAAPALPAALLEGETAFVGGDFARAARAYETFLQSRLQTDGMDRILFRFGVAQSMSGVTAREAASGDAFNQLIRDYPESAFVPPARMVLSLRAEIARNQTDQKSKDDKIRQLTEELDKLKKIDLGRRTP